MKRILFLLITVIVLAGLSVPASAVENGDDASGASFVVPIAIQISSTSWAGCSGALIAPRIVVTAGHCVTDQNGLLTKNVYVGLAGSSRDSVTLQDKVQSIEITSSYQDSQQGKVADDDLAFLVLGKSQSLLTPIYLASEKQTSEMKSTLATLKVFGYGAYGDLSEELVTNPKSFVGVFTTISSNYANSAYIASIKSNVCKGDSGAPVLNITATRVTIVGIVTGGSLNNKCTKFQSGLYLTLFTLIGRYSDLAFASAINVMNAQDQLVDSLKIQIADKVSQLAQSESSSATTRGQLNGVQSSLDTAKTQMADTQASLDASNLKITDLEAQLESAKVTNENLQKKLPQTIQCTKGKVTQKVTGVSPKCPKGYLAKQ